jgi:peptide deformylase
MNHISDWLTHIDNKEDQPYLRSKLLDVNMRLYNRNIHYRKLVLQACNLLKHHAMTKLDGYKLPHGTSGANLGIPWNIVVFVRERGTARAWPVVMINPRITAMSNDMIESESNCGSIRLDAPIKVKRHEWVDVFWYEPTEGGEVAGRHRIFRQESCGFTVQHEIDHNQGILITDREVK